MPRRKHLKRQVRGRMAKTGESYVSALSELRRRAPVAAVARHWGGPRPPAEQRLQQLLARLCARLGCATETDPTVPREWARPAFRVQPAVGAPFYLDLVVAPPRAQARPERAEGILAASADQVPAILERRAEALKLIYALRPKTALAQVVSPLADRLVDPDLPYVIAVSAAAPGSDPAVIEVWAGPGGPHLQVSALLVIEPGEPSPAARLYHHPEPRRPLQASPLLRLPQAVWSHGRYLHGDGESLASLLGDPVDPGDR
jgi:hypothetical protein